MARGGGGMRDALGKYGAGALVGALLLFLLLPSGRLDVGGLAIVRHVTAAEATGGEPDTVRTIVERIVTRQVPVLIRERADSAAAPTVESFCAAAGWSPTGPPTPQIGDPSTGPEPGTTRPAVALIRSFEQKGGDLSLWTVRSDLALELQRYQVCPRSFSGTMQGDVANVTTARLCWLPDAALAFGTAALVFGLLEENLTAAGIGGASLVVWKVAF